MPPIRSSGSRASKACVSCRRQKTRCYESGSTSNACLRCTTLSQKCSLEDSVAQPHSNGVLTAPRGHDCSALEGRVAKLEHLVEELTGLVKPQRGSVEAGIAPSRQSLVEENVEANADDETAPLVVLRNAATDAGFIGQQAGNAIHEAGIVEKGLITGSVLQSMLGVFTRHYGRWCGLDEESSDASLGLNALASPLLQCVACLIAARHMSSDEAGSGVVTPGTIQALYEEAITLLNKNLLQAHQSLDFFHAVTLLSLWPTTVTASPLKLDSWMITGFALQHTLVTTAWYEDRRKAPLSVHGPGETPNIRRTTWTILALSHIYACIGMKRQSMIREVDIMWCLPDFDASMASNFEIRMTAELDLYWTLYRYINPRKIALPDSQSALRTWRNKWAFAFDQPRPYFLQLGFHFAHLLLFEKALSTRSAAARESIVSEMIILCSNIVDLVTETLDDRTQYLTDHIYHVVAFAAITLSRLMCKYSNQLSYGHDLDALDLKVLGLVSWLSRIGSSDHISHAMASVVGDTFRKLRPNSLYDAASFGRDATVLGDVDPAELPEFLNMDIADADWDSLLPDWQSLVSDELQVTTPD